MGSFPRRRFFQRGSSSRHIWPRLEKSLELRRDRRHSESDDPHLRAIRTSSFCCCGMFNEWGVEVERRTSHHPFHHRHRKGADAHEARTVTQSVVFLFLSVAQILDDQPELSCAVTERDLSTCPRQPPPIPLAKKAGRDAQNRKHDQCERSREVIFGKSRKTSVKGIRQKSDSVSGPVHKRMLLGWKFQVCKRMHKPQRSIGVTWLDQCAHLQ